MSVNLSPLGGVAGQFLDNNGVILSGGKIYTYAAGTTTTQATYTSATGTSAHTNPIILDSAGRVPSGEIWLTDSLQYKFVIKTSDDVLIGTYDNIVGINSNFLNYAVQEEIQTATAGQTVFTLSTVTYTPGTNTLQVFVDGVNQYDGVSYAYVETDSTTVTFTAGLHVGALVKFTTATTMSAGVTDAALVTYNPPFVGGVATNVEDKLAQTVSVKDFGAVGDGVTDDTAAFATALAAQDTIYVPAGTYAVTGITMSSNKTLVGAGYGTVINSSGTIDFTDVRKGGIRHMIVNLTAASKTLVRLRKDVGVGSFELYFEDVQFVGDIANASTVGLHITDSYINTFVNCLFIDFDKAIIHGVEANRNNYFGCSIRARTTYGTTLIEQTAGQANSFVGCDVENCNQMLVLSGGSIFFSEGCYFEAHNASFGFDLTGGHVGISHSYFNETFLRVQSGGSLELSKNWIKASSLSNANYPVIRLQSGYAALILDNNIRQGATFLCRMNPTRYDYVQVYDTGTSTWVNEYPSTNQLSINDVIYDVDTASTYQIRLDNARQSRSRASIYTEGRVRFDAGSNGVQLISSAWNYNPLRLGAYYLWVDATGDLRIKNGAPTFDTDGTVVGTQT